MREAVGLHPGDQLGPAEVPQVDGGQPRPQQGARVARLEVGADRARARVALGHDALDHAQDGGRVGRGVVVAGAERPDGERHRGVHPLGRRALLAARRDPARAHLGQERLRRRRLRGLRPGAPDVDAGMVVRAADAGAPVRVDVDGRRAVELLGARAVAHLPDVEQLGQPASVTGGQRRRHRVERVGQGARDAVLVQVAGHVLDVGAVGLQPLVVARRDAVAEDVHGLRLAAERGRELLGHEDVVAVGDGERAIDRVVVGDRHEVHAAALGQRVDLFGRRRALGQAQRALHAEPAELRGGRVAVHVDPAHVAHRPAESLQSAAIS